MSRTMLALAASLVALFSSSALGFADQGNTVTNLTTRVTDDAVEIWIEARDVLEEPRVRTSPGFVRVWFSGMRDTRLSREFESGPIRFVRARPGADETSVTIIRLTDMRRIDPADVSVSREGNVARIRIARRALAAESFDEPLPIEAVESPEVDAEEATDDPEVVVEARESGLGSGSASLALTRSSTEAAGLAGSSTSLTNAAVVALVLLLVAGFVGVRFAQKRGILPRAKRDIEVVAARRLGARHQLFVVRALGEDHLLAVHGGRTERLISVPAPPGEADAADGDEPELPVLKLRGAPKPPPGAGEQKGSSFGQELMKLVGERQRGDQVSVASTPSPASEAVAGLLALRERIGR